MSVELKKNAALIFKVLALSASFKIFTYSTAHIIPIELFHHSPHNVHCSFTIQLYIKTMVECTVSSTTLYTAQISQIQL